MKHSITMLLLSVVLVSAQDIGRFQLAITQDHVYKIDTSSGQTWRLTSGQVPLGTHKGTEYMPIEYWDPISQKGYLQQANDLLTNPIVRSYQQIDFTNRITQ